MQMHELLLRGAIWCQKLSQMQETRQLGDDATTRDDAPSRSHQLAHLAIIVGRWGAPPQYAGRHLQGGQ